MTTETLTPPAAVESPALAPFLIPSLVEKTPAELEALFWAGRAPDLESLVGWEFRGYNHPWWIEPFGIRKFVKGFFRSPGSELIEGFNLEMLQNGLFGEWLGKPSDLKPKRHGYYHVYAVKPEERDNFYPHALLLNYGKSTRNPVFDITRILRDYVVQPYPDQPDLLLGKAYLALGSLRIPVSFFILQRRREHDFRG